MVVVSRWLLVLFTRDFQHIDDIIKLWDGLFADGLDLDLIDYLFIAILLFLKDDRTCCLHLVFVFYIVSTKQYAAKFFVMDRFFKLFCWHSPQ